MDTKRVALEKGKENLRVLMELIGTKVADNKAPKGKDIFSKLSNNIKQNIKDGIQDTTSKANDIINSFKKDSIRNLEKVLRIDKSQLVMTSKKNYIYKTEGDKMIIVDRDIWGEPVLVTTKQNNKVTVKTVKYFENKPYLFPTFDEKKIFGRIINITSDEIWYHDNNEVIVLTFFGEEYQTTKVKVGAVKHLGKEEIFKYVNDYKTLLKNPSMYDLIFNQKGYRVEDIYMVRKSYAIIKQGASFKILILNDSKELIDEIDLNIIPKMDENSMDVLLSPDILKYIKDNGYSIENFKQSGEYIEYWQEIGNKKVCVMRYKA